MFAKLSVLVALLPFVSALTFNVPTNLTSGGPATISWTQESGDPQTFSVELINVLFHNSFAIANNIQDTAGSISITLPSVPVGDGYTLQAVDISNISNVFATSGDFAIAANPISTSTQASSTASSSSASGSTHTAPLTTASSTSSSAFGVTVAPGTSSSASGSTPSSSSSAPSTSPSSFNAAQGLAPNLVSVGSVGAMVLGAVAGAAAFAL
ncbi:hypothetical protein BV25DRAFT_1871527 [Artomyces pyxidatus]|uniref:Uncharacterized protein n=1 Tax=Artomyces pyxidatus TaxID=48021 RepID=A0ACB8SS46_9AGAM|nr:hypothetical protein BV25DRAFT_1871527 [Artomyces pyxidatus]